MHKTWYYKSILNIQEVLDMKKLFRVLSVILVLTLAFPTLVLAGENIQQSSDLVGAE